MSASDVLGEEVCSSGSVLVRDSLQAPGGFVLPLLLKHALRQCDKVIFVAAEQGWGHYRQVMRKLGVDLEGAKENAQIEFISALSNCSEWSAHGGLLEELYKCIAASIASTAASKTGGRISLIVDDLTALCTAAGESRHQAAWIIPSARGLCSKLQVPFRFACLAHQDVDDDRWLTSTVAHSADALVSVESLGSAASHDIHGKVTIAYRNCMPAALLQTGETAQAFYYRFVEGGVKFWEAIDP